MIRSDCLNYDGDEDCHKCCKHGFIFGCEGCNDCETFFTKKGETESAEREQRFNQPFRAEKGINDNSKRRI